MSYDCPYKQLLKVILWEADMKKVQHGATSGFVFKQKNKVDHSECGNISILQVLVVAGPCQAHAKPMPSQKPCATTHVDSSMSNAMFCRPIFNRLKRYDVLRCQPTRRLFLLNLFRTNRRLSRSIRLRLFSTPDYRYTSFVQVSVRTARARLEHESFAEIHRLYPRTSTQTTAIMIHNLSRQRRRSIAPNSCPSTI